MIDGLKLNLIKALKNMSELVASRIYTALTLYGFMNYFLRTKNIYLF